MLPTKVCLVISWIESTIVSWHASKAYACICQDFTWHHAHFAAMYVARETPNWKPVAPGIGWNWWVKDYGRATLSQREMRSNVVAQRNLQSPSCVTISTSVHSASICSCHPRGIRRRYMVQELLTTADYHAAPIPLIVNAPNWVHCLK